MLVDYQRAWIRLGDVIASQPHHGARDLSRAMNRILAECQVPESATEQALRLLAEQAHAPDEPPNGVGDSLPGAMVGRPDHRQLHDREVNDGSRNAGSGRSQGRNRAAA